jgi:acetyl-CoA C-acetyltransferase
MVTNQFSNMVSLVEICPALMLNAPVAAAKKVLAKTGLTPDDIDLWEINEAFAVVAEKFIRDLKLNRDKVNVNGGVVRLVTQSVLLDRS